MTAPPAARTLQRRMRSKVLYRQRRDRKIPVDLLGRMFEYLYIRPIDGTQEWLRVRLVAYHPESATVNLAMIDLNTEPRITWSTDQFWSEYKVGNLRDA